MNWPYDKDGKLLERLRRDAINLSQKHFIEFNIDFQHWPPSREAIDILKGKYGNVKVFNPGQLNELQEGYLSIMVQAKLSYELVTTMQQEITNCVASFGGYCNSWALLQHNS